MVIAINTLCASKVKAGVANYLHGLIHGLAQIDRANKYIIYVGKENRSQYEDLPINFELQEIGFWNAHRSTRFIWEQIVLPYKVWRYDVLLSPGFVAPLIKTCRSVVTVHDMTFFTHPQLHTFLTRSYYTTLMPLSTRRADKILAVSCYTKDEIIRILRTPEDKISVTLESAHERFVPRKSRAPTPYIFFVGMLEPRKNLPRLIEAFSSVPEPYELWIAGKKGWMYDEIFSRVQVLGLEKRVRFLGYVSDEDLPALYSNATLFVYPSLHEGFGIPVLEAMSCGVPVITSNISSLPEVGGDAVRYIDPKNTASLRAAILELLDDPQEREIMSRKGIAQAKKFSWKKTAQETLEVLCPK